MLTASRRELSGGQTRSLTSSPRAAPANSRRLRVRAQPAVDARSFSTTSRRRSFNNPGFTSAVGCHSAALTPTGRNCSSSSVRTGSSTTRASPTSARCRARQTQRLAPGWPHRSLDRAAVPDRIVPSSRFSNGRALIGLPAPTGPGRNYVTGTAVSGGSAAARPHGVAAGTGSVAARGVRSQPVQVAQQTRSGRGRVGRDRGRSQTTVSNTLLNTAGGSITKNETLRGRKNETIGVAPA